MAFVVDVYNGGVYWDNDGYSVVIDVDNCCNEYNNIVVVNFTVIEYYYCCYFDMIVGVVSKNDYDDDDDNYNFSTHNVDIDFGIDSDCSHSLSNNSHIIGDVVDVDDNIVVVAVYSYSNCNIVVVEAVTVLTTNNNCNYVSMPYVYMANDGVIDYDNADYDYYNCFCYYVVLLVYPYHIQRNSH